jgi:GNAT superfamily N-acetyltransferase
LIPARLPVRTPAYQTPAGENAFPHGYCMHLSSGLPEGPCGMKAEGLRVDATRRTVRPAVEADLAVILSLINEKAAFDGCPHAVEVTEERLHKALFASPPLAGMLLAFQEGEAVGFASHYPTFSSFLGLPGIWLDDLFVRPEWRGTGVGTALLRHLGRIAAERGCGRIEWSVAASNDPAIAFYEKSGAFVCDSARLCRLDASVIQTITRQEDESV